MKRAVIFLVSCCIAMGAMAQIQVNSSGDLITNDHEIYLRNQSGNKYGIGYGAFGASEMCFFSDELIEFRESDNSTLAAKFNLNSTPNFEFHGKVTLLKNHWTGGITSQVENFADFAMANLYPATNWYGTLGSSTKRYGGAYIDHAFINQYTTYPSDSRVKENVVNIENALAKVTELRPIQYDIKENFYDSIADPKAREYVMNHGGRNRIGFISQEVQVIFPELVSEEPQSGLLGINTIDMIPYLVQAIKEQQKEIEELKDLLNKETGTANLKSYSLFENESAEAPASLSQNKPNPFSSETRIEMFVPQSVANAILYVYDLQGKQVKSITVTGRGATFETIHGSELQAGLYIYSLVTDGKLIGSKQMVLTE